MIDDPPTAAPCAFTALICTYNNAAMLRSTLEHLVAQHVAREVHWETIVVENNCSDETIEIVLQFQASGRLPNVRLFSESQQGVGHARRTGMRAVRGALIAFVDDDCWLGPNWIDEAIRFAAAHPQAGAFGGRNELLWQAPPPAFVADYGDSLARQDFGELERELPNCGKQVPCGAGVVLRREALLAGGWLDDGCLRGRDPRYVGAGEDTEIVLRIRNAGWQVWYTPRLRLQHVIPPQRMTLRYLRRLHRGFGRVEVFLRNVAIGGDRSWRARCTGMAWAAAQMIEVWQRFWLGFVRHVAERPSWLIRLSFATGCVEGAVRFLLSGRAA